MIRSNLNLPQKEQYELEFEKEETLFFNLNWDIRLMATLKSTKQDIVKMTAEDVATIADRLEQDEYDSPFAALEDWHLLRAIAFQREELAQPYIHLLDIEAYDEA